MAFEFETASVGGHVQAAGSASVPADLPMPVLLVGQITLGVGPVSGREAAAYWIPPSRGMTGAGRREKAGLRPCPRVDSRNVIL